MTSVVSIPAISGGIHELTLEEREQAHLFLKQTQNCVTGAIRGLSAAQWNFNETPERWSIAQIVEHIVFVIDRVGGPLREALAQAPPPPADRDYQYVDAVVIHRFPTRLAKFTSPEFALPVGRFGSLAEALDALQMGYARLTQYLEETPDLRSHAIEAIPLKAATQGAYDVMDGYQWILAAAAHAERHTKQILEVRADKNFPAS